MNKIPEFAETVDGRRRFWACINSLMSDGGLPVHRRFGVSVGKHPAEMGWEETAAKMTRFRGFMPRQGAEGGATHPGEENEEVMVMANHH